MVFYTDTALQPKPLDSYLVIRAFSRYVECLLLLMHQLPSKVRPKNAKQVRRKIYIHTICSLKPNKLQALKKFKIASKNFRVFRSRYLMFSAYYTLIEGSSVRANRLLKNAYFEANRIGTVYDMEWCLRHKKSWCGSTSADKEFSHLNNGNEIYMFIFQRY